MNTRVNYRRVGREAFTVRVKLLVELKIRFVCANGFQP